MDQGSVEDMSDRLGVSSRHLNRLFQKHLSASPTRVAATLRVQRAKRLIDGTDLPLTDIAYQSGFNSIRRFNAAFQDLFGRPPSSFRKDPPQPPA